MYCLSKILLCSMLYSFQNHPLKQNQSINSIIEKKLSTKTINMFKIEYYIYFKKKTITNNYQDTLLKPKVFILVIWSFKKNLDNLK